MKLNNPKLFCLILVGLMAFSAGSKEKSNPNSETPVQPNIIVIIPDDLENDFREKSDISNLNPEKVKYLLELLEKIKKDDR